MGVNGKYSRLSLAILEATMFTALSSCHLHWSALFHHRQGFFWQVSSSYSAISMMRLPERSSLAFPLGFGAFQKAEDRPWCADCYSAIAAPYTDLLATLVQKVTRGTTDSTSARKDFVRYRDTNRDHSRKTSKNYYARNYCDTAFSAGTQERFYQFYFNCENISSCYVTD